MILNEIKEYKFHQNKHSILIKSIDINKIIVPNKLPLTSKNDIKYFIGYKDAK